MIKKYSMNMDTGENMFIELSHSNEKYIDAFIDLIEDCLPNNMSIMGE